MQKLNTVAFRLVVPVLVVLALLASTLSAQAGGISAPRIFGNASGTAYQEPVLPGTMIPSITFGPYTAYKMSGAFAASVTIGDFNSDGRNDVAVTDTYNKTGVWIFLQQDNGTLAVSKIFSSGTYMYSPTTGDFNHDGRDDLAVSIGVTIYFYYQTEDGQLAGPVSHAMGTGASTLLAGDFNQDGLDDLAVCLDSTSYLGIYYQKPDGTLGAMIKYPSIASVGRLASGDFNHDGLTDIVKLIAKSSVTPNLLVYLQQPGGGFADPVPYALSGDWIGAVVAGDFNGDGLDDIAIDTGAATAQIAIFTQNASGQMENPVIYVSNARPQAMQAADINMDGRMDLMTANGGQRSASVIYQKSDGKLAPYYNSTIPYVYDYAMNGLGVGDLNNDGLPDAAIADSNSGLVVLYNQLKPDFQITAIPGVLPLEQGKQAQIQLNLDTQLGFNEPVTYTVSGATSGVAYSFSENPVTGPTSTTLYLYADPATVPGDVRITITGTSPSRTHTATLIIQVRQHITGLNGTATGTGGSAYGGMFFGTPVQFKATVTAGSHIVYFWDFGDGAQGSGQSVNHTYSTLGEFYVTVTAKNEISNQVAAATVNVVDVPISNMTSTWTAATETDGMIKYSANITAGTHVKFHWDFGDGSTGDGQSASHIYAKAGTYPVNLSAENGQGSSATTMQVVVPTFRFIHGLSAMCSQAQLGSAARCQASVQTGENVSYSWDFGDGTSGSGQVVDHIYAATGSYNVLVTATNTYNTTKTSTSAQVVDAQIHGLQITAVPSSEEEGLLNFTAALDSGTNVTYAWNFGDGGKADGLSASHFYEAPGSYTVTLTAANSQNQQIQTAEINVQYARRIYGLTAGASSENVRVGDSVSLHAAVQTGEDVSYSWDFGDGTHDSGPDVSHTYEAPGKYTAKVTAENSINSLETFVTVMVVDVPISGLTLKAENSKTTLGRIDFTAEISSGTNARYEWDFGDGQTGSGASTIHVYRSFGKHTVKLTVFNGQGNQTGTIDVWLDYVLVIPLVIAAP